MNGTGAALDQAFDYCGQRVREADNDRFLASLFVPAPQRGPVLALYAFDCEVMQVRDRITSPLPGEVRLQYWRDVLTGTGQGDLGGNPVAAALTATVRQYALPVPALLDLLDARTFDLYDDAMATLTELERYAAASSAAVFALPMQILNQGTPPGLEVLLRHAAIASTVTHILQQLPLHALRGQIYLPAEVVARHGAATAEIKAGRNTPQLRAALAELRGIARDHLAAVHRGIARVPAQLLPALLPLALIPAVLKRMDNRYDPFRPPVLPAWRRQWTLWRAARRPRQLIGVA